MSPTETHDPQVDAPGAYQHRFADVNGIRIHYVEEGTGSARHPAARLPVPLVPVAPSDPAPGAVIPAMVPHGVVNTGDEPLKVVGFFCESEVTSSFEAPLQPFGEATVTM